MTALDSGVADFQKGGTAAAAVVAVVVAAVVVVAAAERLKSIETPRHRHRNFSLEMFSSSS